MSAHVLLNLLNELGIVIKREVFRATQMCRLISILRPYMPTCMNLYLCWILL